jgi:hypothetical protein
VCAVGFLPLLNQREKVLTVEGHQGSAFGRGKSQLLDIGQSEISSLLCGQAIHSVRRQCDAEHNRNVFIPIQLHSWSGSNLRRGECLRVESVTMNWPGEVFHQWLNVFDRFKVVVNSTIRRKLFTMTEEMSDMQLT